MSSNRIDVFTKIEKNSENLESYKGIPLVFFMKEGDVTEKTYSDVYVGILDCVEENKIYLNDSYKIDDEVSTHMGDEFKKWDLSREDPTIEEFPHINLELVDSIYASKLNLTLEQVWNVWSDPRDLVKTQNQRYQKIQNTFSRCEKTFSEKSKPVFFNKAGRKISLEEIHQIESIDDKPISMIAVTRHQYDVSNFSKYEDYIKNTLNKSRKYFGLWSDGKKMEYDVLYAIPTDDFDELQKHLNAHDHMNDGITQEMALIIFQNGAWKIVENTKFVM